MQLSEFPKNKIKSVNEAAALAAALKVKGLKVVLATGCFDILHSGHLQVFRAARKMGEMLIVGLNSDDSIKKLKGPNRPILGQDERLLNVVSSVDVDYAVIFGEDTPIELIENIRPDFFVKGGDWSEKPLPETAAVRDAGGQVMFVPFKINISASKIIENYDQFREA